VKPLGPAVAGLVLLVSCSGSTSHATMPTRVGPAAPASRSLVVRADWTHRAAGFRLRVQPTSVGRLSTAEHPDATLAQSITAAGPVPLHLTPDVRRSLTDQLRCHAAFAPRKPEWNLETWRPAVGYLKTVLHECNP
jgi:hypothetical protein